MRGVFRQSPREMGSAKYFRVIDIGAKYFRVRGLVRVHLYTCTLANKL